MQGLILLLSLGLLLALLLTIALTARSLTRPIRRTYATALARGRPGDPAELRGVYHVSGTQPLGIWPRPYDTWSFRAGAHSLPVWRVKGDKPSGPIAILTHGWGDSRIGALSRLAYIAAHCKACILYDLPGHGDAPGSCTLGTHETRILTSLIAHARELDPNTPILLFGWSMGAGISIAAAVHDAASRDTASRDTASTHTAPNRICAVIAESPYRHAFTPAANVLRLKGLPNSWTLRAALFLLGIEFGVGRSWRGFDRASLASKLSCPLLIIHGVDDEVCPISDGRDIANSAHNASLLTTFLEVPGGTHHGLWTDPSTLATIIPALDIFMQQVSTATLSSPSNP